MLHLDPLDCDMVKTDYVLKDKGFPLYVCKRKGCRGHAFDTGKGRAPRRRCNHPRIGLGTLAKIVFTPIKWFAIVITFGQAFKTDCGCKQREVLWNSIGLWSPFYKKRNPPWESKHYRDSIIKL